MQKRMDKKDSIYISILIMLNIVAALYLQKYFIEEGLFYYSGDNIWVSDVSITGAAFFYFHFHFSKLSVLKRILYSAITLIASFVVAWGGYYYLFLILKFLRGNNFIRDILITLYFALPFSIILLVVFISGKKSKKVSNK
jgi:hypothetical protein